MQIFSFVSSIKDELVKLVDWDLWGDPALEEADKFAVWKWTPLVNGLALGFSSNTSDLGGDVELDGWGEDVDEGHAFRGAGDCAGNLFNAVAEVFVGEGFKGDGKVGLGVDLANEGLHAIVLVVDGSLEENLPRKKALSNNAKN